MLRWSRSTLATPGSSWSTSVRRDGRRALALCSRIRSGMAKVWLDPVRVTRDDPHMVARTRGDPIPSQNPERRGPGLPGNSAPITTRSTGLLDFVAPAGNRAVGRFVRSLQRVDYTQPVADVEKSGITRLEVHGLTYGVDDFWKSY